VKAPGLGLKLVVFGVALTGVIIGSAFLALGTQIGASTKRFFTLELRRNQNALVALQQQATEQLLSTSQLMTQSPTLRAAIETYRVEATGGAPRAELITTVRREAGKILSGLGRDLIIVTDEAGRVLVGIERHGAAPPGRADLATLPPVARSLDPNVPAEEASTGVARFAGVDFQIGCVPIVLQDAPIGVLIVGDRLDSTYVRTLKDQLSADIVVAAQHDVLATTLPDSAARQLVAGLSDGGTARAGSVEYATGGVPLGADAGGRPVTLFLLHSITDAIAPLSRSMRIGFLFYGVLAIALAGLGAAAVARTVLQPLERFVGFVHAAAESGDYRKRFATPPTTREIATLNESYDRLVGSIARQHEQLEQANVDLRAQIHERERAEAALRQSEEQLRQAQKLDAIGRLAGGVAHDFNNILTIILSYTQLLRKSMAPDSPMRADLDQVDEAARRAGTLTHQLLAFSRKQVLQPRVIDLSAVVEGIEPMLSRLVGEDIELRAVVRPPVSRVKADPGQIEQVLLNLVANARDAMPKGGTVTITTQDVPKMEGEDRPLDGMRRGPWVLLTVHDTGVGMDAATQARIFEPFFTTKEPGKGTGLGLAMVYGIIKQSGGFIWVDSAPGQGTTFRIYLPPVVDAGAPLAATPTPPPPPRGTETILVVEDEDPVRELAERCLRAQGYRVLTAVDGVAALALADAHRGPIDLVLTDVLMPRLSGMDLVERLVAVRPTTRVLYMSGYPQGVVGGRGVSFAESEFLQKPFLPDDLARRVRAVLDAAHAPSARG
jgi:signal transduction histidine kinase/ActR/RegA family two-component response regulator